MHICRNVLSHLDFTSDLGVNGTLQLITSRLSYKLQIQWVRKASKIFDSDRNVACDDLSIFVEKRAKEYGCQFDQSYAEMKNAATTKANPMM